MNRREKSSIKVQKLEPREPEYPCDSAMNAAMKNSSNTIFTKQYLNLLIACFYWLELCNCFGRVIILSVPSIVYINLVKPIIRFTRYSLEEHSGKRSFRMIDWLSGYIYPHILGLFVCRHMRVHSSNAYLRVLGNCFINLSCLLPSQGTTQRRSTKASQMH